MVAEGIWPILFNVILNIKERVVTTLSLTHSFIEEEWSTLSCEFHAKFSMILMIFKLGIRPKNRLIWEIQS